MKIVYLLVINWLVYVALLKLRERKRETRGRRQMDGDGDDGESKVDK